MSGRSTRSSYEEKMARFLQGERLVIQTPPWNGLRQVREAQRAVAANALRRRDPRDPGADKARARLERKHALALRKAFAKTVRVIVPPRSTARTLTAEAVVGRLRERQGILRAAIVAMLTDAVLLGAAHGWEDVEGRMGIRTNAVLGITWDLIHQAALAWVVSGNGPAGLPDWGMGYDGADELVAQVVRTSEAQLRPLVGVWIQEGAPLPTLITRMEAVTFSRERAKVIAVTEVTRAYALGNILAWQQGVSSPATAGRRRRMNWSARSAARWREALLR